jgi:hypothetical protein
VLAHPPKPRREQEVREEILVEINEGAHPFRPNDSPGCGLPMVAE